MAYNATATKTRTDGSVFSVEAVEVNGEGQVIRACGLWSHLSGTPEFNEVWENAQFSEVFDIHIEVDDAAGYRAHLASLLSKND